MKARAASLLPSPQGRDALGPGARRAWRPSRTSPHPTPTVPLALAALLLALALACTSPLALAASAVVAPRTTLPAVESQVMCVTCKIPLTVAQSPQADRERAFIQRLLTAGDTEEQIKRALVREYGPAVLALPSTSGFDLAAYLVPVAVVVALAGLLVLLLPRWRRRGRGAAGEASAAAATLTPADTARLEADMARFD